MLAPYQVSNGSDTLSGEITLTSDQERIPLVISQRSVSAPLIGETHFNEDFNSFGSERWGIRVQEGYLRCEEVGRRLGGEDRCFSPELTR